MTNEKGFQMDFGKVYELLLNKAVKKGRTQTEVDEVICWLTGYNTESLEKAPLHYKRTLTKTAELRHF